MARVGDVVLVCYDIPGRALFHERIITAVDPETPGQYAVLTPDLDHYVEDCRVTEDIRETLATLGLGDVPRALAGRPTGWMACTPRSPLWSVASPRSTAPRSGVFIITYNIIIKKSDV